MSNLSDNEILTKITEKREYWNYKNREERIKLEAKRDGYYEAISDIRGIIIDEIFKEWQKELKLNDKYIDVIRLMAKKFMSEIDIDKYYKKYNNMTEADLIDYFVKEVEKSE